MPDNRRHGREPIKGALMTRRVLAVGLAGASFYAAVLAGSALGQAPTPEPTPEAVATPIATPAPMASEPPAETVAPVAPEEPIAAPPPEETAVGAPEPPATAPPAATPPPAATAPSAASAPEAAANPEAAESPAAGAGPRAGRGGKSTPRSEPRRHRPNAEADDGDAREVSTGERDDRHHDERAKLAPRLTRPDGSPAPSNPSYALATPGPAPIGVPNFFIDKFRIPPFLLPIYQAAGMQYGVSWEILAAINEIETDYGRNLNVSSAGARGWMQFMPSTWAAYGVDANRDGVKDPYNPVDAIFAAARYLRAAGAERDIRAAVFAYNHADWYVDSVLMRAELIGGIPGDLVGSLTGLTQGRFPVHAKATYAGHLVRRGRTVSRGNAAMVVEGDGMRRAIEIYSRPGAPIIAVNDGKVVKLGRSKRLGRFLTLQDAYGNIYTYGHLGHVARTYPVPKGRSVRSGSEASIRPPLGFDAEDFTPRPLTKGARVIGGTILARLARAAPGTTAHLLFEIRPAGRGAPRIDPKPILDGWKLLESTAAYRAKGENPLLGAGAADPSIGQLLLLSKHQLVRRVLADPRIQIYGCGRGDIRAGHIDRRVLATMLYLTASGLRPTISSLKCGHGYLTASGNVSEHSTGTAMDIAAINGITITPATQGPGSITDLTIQRLLKLQGTMRPHQIISLMTFEGADNTIAMGDHHDHIHVGWRPLYGPNRQAARQIDAVLQPAQWIKLIDRLRNIDNPTVREQPSRYSVEDVKRASRSHRGE